MTKTNIPPFYMFFLDKKEIEFAQEAVLFKVQTVKKTPWPFWSAFILKNYREPKQ